MFDKLVESSKQQRKGRTGLFFFATSLIYAVVLMVLGVLTVFWFNPSPVEAFNVICALAPPPPPPAPAPAPEVPRNDVRPVETAHPFAPTNPSAPIPPPTLVPPGSLVPISTNSVPGGANGGLRDGPGVGVPGGNGTSDPPPPPPPSTPAPKPTPTPTPEAPKQITVTSQLLQGNAITKVQPPYPQIAKAIHASGPVQVQVTISEEGRVTEAVVLSGHPTLREVSAQAARQWVFRPTILNRVPVRVTGIITFNFVLN